MSAETPVYPELHPRWCDELYVPEACEVHMTGIGLIEVADDVHLSVLLDDSGENRGLVVTVSVLSRTGEVNHPVPIELEPKPGKRRQHAFTLERTRGDHFVWSCRCGDVFVQDPGTDIQQTLIEHAGGKR